MTDIQAAVGRVQLERLPEILDRRVELAAATPKRFATSRASSRPSFPSYARPNYQSYPVRVAPDFPLSPRRAHASRCSNGGSAPAAGS